MKFIGREKELASINRKLANDRSECMLIYGRRRVGKSELIKESLRQVEATLIHYVCRKAAFDPNMDVLSRAVAEAFDEPVQFGQLDKLLDYLYKKARHKVAGNGLIQQEMSAPSVASSMKVTSTKNFIEQSIILKSKPHHEQKC